MSNIKMEAFTLIAAEEQLKYAIRDFACLQVLLPVRKVLYISGQLFFVF